MKLRQAWKRQVDNFSNEQETKEKEKKRSETLK